MTMNYRAVVSKNHHIRREIEGRTGFEHEVPAQSVLDRIADESITKKWNVKRSNLCAGCFTYKSVTGGCLC